MVHGSHSTEHQAGHHAMDESSAQVFLRRFYYTTALLIPLLLVSEVGVRFFGVPDFTGRQYVGFGLSVIIFYFSLIFFEHASHEIKHRQYGMMTLVSLALASGFSFSVASTFLPYFGGMEFYLEISTLIWVLLFGHYLEAKSTAAAGSALQEVAKLLPKQAHLLHGEMTHDVPIDQLKVGDLVVVKPGEKVPADGSIIDGSANMNEALVTGESTAVAKAKGHTVIAGSICTDGSLTIRVEKVGLASTVGQIQQLVEVAHTTKPQLQYVADRVASWLTFFALFTAILTVFVWTLVIGKTFAFSLTLAVTVLVIACPHALGLAIPTVSTIATSLALKYGIFIKSLQKLEAARNISYVAFDKTGTLTEGKPSVVDIVVVKDSDKKTVIRVAASLEQGSSHPLAQAIIEKAKEDRVAITAAASFKNIAGKGISGVIGTTEYFLGNKQLIEARKLRLDNLESDYEQLSNEGKTVVMLATKAKVIGLIAIADTVRSESIQAVKQLHDLGIKVAMITGDTVGVAKSVAAELGIDTYFAEVLPEDKYKKIQELQAAGNAVMMVGDGVNDAPALIQANVGVAIGSGTDVTVEAGDIILTKNNPADIPRLLVLSRKVYSKMVQNLVWAVGYNAIAIPAAAGVFAGFGIFLRPDVGAGLMAMSSVIVVVNAMQLRRLKL